MDRRTAAAQYRCKRCRPALKLSLWEERRLDELD
jgi:hypothetical protein